MKTFTVQIHVPAASAIAACEVAYGDTERPVTKEELASLSAEERQYLVHASSNPALRIVCESASWEHVTAALRASKADAEASREREISRLLQREDDTFFDARGSLFEHRIDQLRRLNDERCEAKLVHLAAQEYHRMVDAYEPRFVPNGNGKPELTYQPLPAVARDAEVLRKIEEARRACQAAIDESKADEEAERLRLEREIKSAQLFVVAHVPEYARAAQAGCDVRRKADEAIFTFISDDIRSSGFTIVDAYDHRPQPVPKTRAFETLDAVRSILSEAESRAYFGAMSVRSVDIVRADLCPEVDETQWHTCVRIVVRGWLSESTIMVSAEESDA